MKLLENEIERKQNNVKVMESMHRVNVMKLAKKILINVMGKEAYEKALSKHGIKPLII